MEVKNAKVLQAIAQEVGTPAYVYDLDIVNEHAARLVRSISWRPFLPLFAIKANPCPAVARALCCPEDPAAVPYGVDAVSPGEVELALKLGVPASRVLYTENNMTDAEMHSALAKGVTVNCGSLDRLERLAALQRPCNVSVRFNPMFGAGHHEHVITAGPKTKFGVRREDVANIRRIEEQSQVRVVGCHMHIGSGFLDASSFVNACSVLFGIANELPHLQFIDVGGGIGIPYKPTDQPIDIEQLGAALSAQFAAFCERYRRPLELRLEPGRFLVAESGVLLTTVTSIKTGAVNDPAVDVPRVFVGTDTGFNHLARVAMYGAYHRIANVTKLASSTPGKKTRVVDVVGNICETGDVFARDREVDGDTALGDVLAICDAGAYGMSMASTYNTRPLPAEVVIVNGKYKVVRKPQTIDDLLAQYQL